MDTSDAASAPQGAFSTTNRSDIKAFTENIRLFTYDDEGKPYHFDIADYLKRYREAVLSDVSADISAQVKAGIEDQRAAMSREMDEKINQLKEQMEMSQAQQRMVNMEITESPCNVDPNERKRSRSASAAQDDNADFIEVTNRKSRKAANAAASNNTVKNVVNNSSAVASSSKATNIRIVNSKNVNSVFSNTVTGGVLPKRVVTQNATTGLLAQKAKPVIIKTPDNKFVFLKNLGKVIRGKFVARNNGLFLKLFPDSQDTHRELTKHFDKEKVDYYLFPERLNPPLKVVIRQLPHDTPVSLIEEELKDQGFDIQKVTQMVSFRTKLPMPLFQIHLTNNSEAEKIFELSSLLHMSINVETYRNPTRTMQCFRCQYFHHKSENCRMTPRCVKCTGAHETNQCPLGTEKIDSPKCCNCGGNHAASYRGCSKFPRRVNPIPARTVSPGLQYAQVAASGLSPATDPSAPSADMVQTLVNLQQQIVALSLQLQNLSNATIGKNATAPSS